MWCSQPPKIHLKDSAAMSLDSITWLVTVGSAGVTESTNDGFVLFNCPSVSDRQRASMCNNRKLNSQKLNGSQTVFCGLGFVFHSLIDFSDTNWSRFTQKSTILTLQVSEPVIPSWEQLDATVPPCGHSLNYHVHLMISSHFPSLSYC